MYKNQKKRVLWLVIACGCLVFSVLRVLHAPDSLDNIVKLEEPVPAEEQSLLSSFTNSNSSNSSHIISEDKLASSELKPEKPVQPTVDNLPQTYDEIAVEQKNGYAIKYRKREMMLKFARGASDEEINALLLRHNLERIESDSGMAKIGYIKVRIPENQELKGTLQRLRKDEPGLITKAEPNFMMSALSIADPLYSEQWYVQAAKFDQAWGVLESTNTVIVAVVDTGVESSHPDLIGKCLGGYNAVAGNEDTQDDHGHGTFVSGIIAASWNDEGIRGLCPNVRILPVKALDATGAGTYEDVAVAIVYAADQGAAVINLSLGGYAYSYVLQDAVDYALEQGIILVAAGGNDGIDQEIYPAAYADVIGVGSVGVNGEVLPYSNSGSHIDCVATGENILSTGTNGQYIARSGTSASAAVVSSLTALLVSEKEGLSTASLRRSIFESAKDMGDVGVDHSYGFGLIDPSAAIGWRENVFHDVGITKISFDSMVIQQENKVCVNVNVANLGTYKHEIFDVVLYQGVGDERQQISARDDVMVMNSADLSFEWDISSLPTNVEVCVTAVVTSETDSYSANNERSSRTLNVGFQDDLIVLYSVSPPVHQWIAGEAFQLAKSVLSTAAQNEFDDYIPAKTTITVDGHQVQGYDGGLIIDGSRQEDEVGTMPYNNHFWDQDAGENGGKLPIGSENAYQRADRFWDDAVADYEDGRPADAYWTLGRIVHLLTDMSVPAHVHNDMHPPGLTHDSYEVYMGEYNDDVNSNYNYHQWTASGAPVSKSSLFDFFNDLADTADDYDSNGFPGEFPSNHTEGHSRTWEKQGSTTTWWDVSYAEAKNHGEVLVPLAMRYVAGLYVYFWNETHPNQAPNTPYNEDPDDGATGISRTANLDWSCTDTDGDTVYYTVYLEKGDSTPNDIIKNDSTGSNADPGTLDYDSHYYWKVVADDHNGGVTTGPIWDFWTVSAPPKPDLLVTHVTPDPFPSDSKYYVGDRIIWNTTVKNDGAGAAGSSSVGYYLGTSSSGLNKKIGDDGVNSLDTAETGDESLAYTFQMSDAGTRYLVCKADWNENIAEEDDENNLKHYGPFTVIPLYHLSVINGEGSTVFTNTTGSAIINADPASVGKVFTGWTASPLSYAGNIADASAMNTTFTMPTEDVTLTANYESIISYAGLHFRKQSEDGGYTVYKIACDAYLGGEHIHLVSSASLTTPLDENFTYFDDGEWHIYSPPLSSIDEFNARFPGGDYLIDVTYTDASTFQYVISVSPIAELPIPVQMPLVSVSGLDSKGYVDPLQEITISWEPWTNASPSGGVGVWIRAEGMDEEFGYWLESTATNLVIPANTIPESPEISVFVEFRNEGTYSNQNGTHLSFDRGAWSGTEFHTMDLSVLHPDFVVEQWDILDVQPSYASGDAIETAFSFGIATNSEQVGTIPLKIFLSSDQHVDESDYVFMEANAGESWIEGTTRDPDPPVFGIPEGLFPGDYYFGLILDADELYSDPVRSNNIAWAIDQVKVRVPSADDTDGDGLPNSWESIYFSNAVAAVASHDSDGDGHNNYQEFISGMNPTNPTSYFAITNQSMFSSYAVEWPCFTGRWYEVLWTSSLTNSFQALTNNIQYPQNSYTDTVHGAESTGYYKVNVRLK